MSAQHSRGAKPGGAKGPEAAPKKPNKPSWPNDPRGKAATGRISKLMVGQGHGYVTLTDDREIYFHRGDMKAGSAFNELQVGDTVTFELLEDNVSGARALRLRRRKTRA
jgi:hypothetical protein